MPIKTINYMLEAFLDGDSYSSIADKRRFSTIDNQFNRITEIIGDGRIDGWTIENGDVFPKILISPGTGIVDGYYVTTFDSQSFELNENGTFYVYIQHRVGIVGSVGPKSNVASITYNDAGAPSSVLSFTATALSPFVVSLRWIGNSEIDLDHYDIERSTNGTDYTALTSVSESNTAYEDSVEEDTTYYYKIYAVDESGYRSDSSSTSVIVPLDTALPPNPINVLMPHSESAINVLWKHPPALSLSKISYWKITYVELNSDNTENTSSQESFLVNKELFNDRIDDLLVGQRYKVTIQTVDSKGRESSGVSTNVTPQPTPAPRDPQAIAYTMEESPSGVQINLTWIAGDTPYDPAISYRYKVYIQVDGQDESRGIDVPIGETEEQISLYTFNLIEYIYIPENTLVTIRITSVDESGFESFGNFSRFYTSFFKFAKRLGNAQGTFDNANARISITWENQNDTDDILLVVARDSLEDAYINNVQVLNTRIGLVNTYVLENVALNNKYTISLTPFNESDIAGPVSVVVVLSLLPGGLPEPEPPTEVEAIPNDRQIKITWTASSTLYTTFYKIYKKSGQVSLDFTDWALLDTMPSTIINFIDYQVLNDTTYSYYVTSVDIYGRESEHLIDNSVNLNFVESIPRREGILTEPEDVVLSLSGNDVTITWDALLEEFDSFVIYRSIGNLHEWTAIATVSKSVFSYTDNDIPLVDNTVFYYMVGKTFNDADFIIQTTDIQPEKSIFLAKIIVGSLSIDEIDFSDRRDIKDLLDPLTEYTSTYILPHRHTDSGKNNADRIDLNPELIITDWTTVDGRIFTTEEIDISGTSYIVKVNDKFPKIFFSIDTVGRRLVFSENLVEINAETGEIVGDIPEIEVRVLGVEEVQGQLEDFRFDKIHARQVQYGILNKEQLPSINHEGRIREILLPKRFLLERFSNHTFIVSQINNDETKNFGNGTNFYAIAESDGQIENITNFENELNGSVVCFNRPSSASDTISNLKQSFSLSEISSGLNNATQYIYVGSTTWTSSPSELLLGNFSSPPAFDGEVYLRFNINIRPGVVVSTSYVQFTASGSDQSNGDSVRMRVSVLDPGQIADTVDLSSEAITAIPTMGYVDWIIPAWSADETSAYTRADITELLQVFIDHQSYYSGKPMIIKFSVLGTNGSNNYRKAYSFANIAKSPSLYTEYVVDVAEVNSDPGGFQSVKSYHFQFQFEDNSPYRWIRLTTEDCEKKPNPIINLKKRIRFRVLSPTTSLYLAIGIREIQGSDLTVGSDGGTDGSIEWIGINSTITNNSDTIPLGVYISQSDDWQEVDIDPQKTKIISYLDGNNILSTKFGVLEHMAITIDPANSNSTNIIDLYIDDVQQVSDLLVSGTSQGILLSQDFGSNWSASRLTDTPVHKFYKAVNNRYLWAISSTEVLLATDPAFWFSTSGTSGIQCIRDIAEDMDGNIYISTERGVYWLEISLVTKLAVFNQTHPITAFTTDCYALYHNGISSGLDEIWVSTELGIYKTNDHGETWSLTELDTEGLVSFKIENINSNIDPVLIAITRKHVLRKTKSDTTFVTIANLEEQLNIFDIWNFVYFANKIYISTGSGVFISDDDPNNKNVLQITFRRVFSDLDVNNYVKVAFCLNVVDFSNDSKLFIGVENKLLTADTENTLKTKKEFFNKELPSFFIDDEEIKIGYTYNAFNKVLVFREPVLINKIVSASYLPRRVYVAKNGGWSQTNPSTEFFIFQNGFPKWLDFSFNQSSILGDIQVLSGNLNSLPELTTFNSNFPNSATYLEAVESDISTINTGGENSTPLINNTTIIKFVDDLTLFISSVSESTISASAIFVPKIIRSGINRNDRISSSRANIIESQNGFTAASSIGINVDIVTGTVDFTSAYASATTSENKALFTFNKFDRLEITIFNSNIANTGEYAHRELEDFMEYINSGLTSDLTRTFCTNLIKAGIFIDARHNDLFDSFNVSRIQSKFNSAKTNDWYDMLNSTIDYNSIISVSTLSNSRFVTKILSIENPYYPTDVWIGTDKNIYEYTIYDNNLKLINIIYPDGIEDCYIVDLFGLSDTIYVVYVSNDQYYISSTNDYGTTWGQIETINLPNSIYGFSIINGIKMAATSAGVWYCDNDFGTWYQCGVSISNVLGSNSPAATSFNNTMLNMELSTFVITESDRWFFVSGSGPEFFAAGRITNNNTGVVNKIMRFKSNTWIATDKGLYSDGNSILSDNVQFAFQDIESSITNSTIPINDIDHGAEEIYCCSAAGKIYRFWDEDEDDDINNEWKYYKVPNMDTIHKIKFVSHSAGQYLIATSYSTISLIDITPGTGVFN